MNKKQMDSFKTLVNELDEKINVLYKVGLCEAVYIKHHLYLDVAYPVTFYKLRKTINK